MGTITKGFLTSTVNGIKINSSYPCNQDNYTNKSSRNVKYVVIHYTGNKSADTAKANCKYFQGENRSASAHFFCDNTNIYQSVELRDSAWHCGTSGTYYHTSCRNSNSIGIEMCCTSGNYTVSETTQINAAYLCAHLCEMLGISKKDVDTYVLRHYDVTHKSCPKQFVNDSSKWTRFKKWVKNILETGDHEGYKNAPLKVTSSKKEIQKFLNTYYGHFIEDVIGDKLEIDGSFGAKSKKALAVAFQVELNRLGAGLSVDGSFGGGTAKAFTKYVGVLKKGVKGNIFVTLWQCLVVGFGYNPNGIDGSFGNGCVDATNKLFKAKGITKDSNVSGADINVLL